MDMKETSEKADQYLESFGLVDCQNDYVSTYSGGMAQCLKIARNVAHTEDPVLNEPTTGFDPTYCEILWKEILNHEAGTTIFLTTHYIDEPERFCKHITIVSHGQIVAQGTVPALKALVPTDTVVNIRMSG